MKKSTVGMALLFSLAIVFSPAPVQSEAEGGEAVGVPAAFGGGATGENGDKTEQSVEKKAGIGDVRDCGQLTAPELVDLARGRADADAQFLMRVLPGGDIADLVINRAASYWEKAFFCAVIVWEDKDVADYVKVETGTKVKASQETSYLKVPSSTTCRPAHAQLEKFQPVEVVSLAYLNEGKTAARIRLPKTDNWTWCTARIVLLALRASGDDEERVQFAYSRIHRISNRSLALVLAVGLALAAYLGTAVAVNSRRGRRQFFRLLDPVTLTAGVGAHASLSKLQAFGFSLVVSGLVTYFVIRTGALTELSGDILSLLGISAGGAAGAKLTGVARNRLSAENYAWLEERGWLEGQATGSASRASQQQASVARLEGSQDVSNVKWGDLLTSDGEFDVYKFQMAIFSVVVAIALLTTGMTDLSRFAIPPTLLGVLGLSQVVYLAGKAVTPSGFNDLNKKLNQIRDREKDFVDAVAKAWQAKPPASRNIDNAKQVAMAEYNVYSKDVDQAAELFKALFGMSVAPELREAKLS